MILDKSKPDVINCYNASSDVSELPFELNSIPEVEKENQNFTQIQSIDLSSDLWQIEDAEVLAINIDLLKKHSRFGDFSKVRGGIQALWNRAYHINVNSLNANGTLSGNTHLEENITLEIDACRPLITNEGFYPFRDDTTHTYVIFPYDIIDGEKIQIPFDEYENRYPLVGAYLKRQKTLIKDKVQTKPDDNWHLYTRENSHERTFDKVLLPMTSNDTYATITKNPLNYCDNANMYFIDLPDKSDINLFAVAGIINSTIFSVLARPVANPQSGGYFKFNKQFIEPLPFPKENFKSNIGLVTEISVLAQTIQQTQEQYKHSSPRQKTVLKATLSESWANLDSKVYQLYDLTVDQISFFNERGRNINRLEILNRL